MIGTYSISTPWDDAVCTVDLHYILKNSEKAVDPDSYVHFNYMGESQQFMYRGIRDANTPYPFTDPSFSWESPWTAPE